MLHPSVQAPQLQASSGSMANAIREAASKLAGSVQVWDEAAAFTGIHCPVHLLTPPVQTHGSPAAPAAPPSACLCFNKLLKAMNAEPVTGPLHVTTGAIGPSAHACLHVWPYAWGVQAGVDAVTHALLDSPHEPGAPRVADMLGSGEWVGMVPAR